MKDVFIGFDNTAGLGSRLRDAFRIIGFVANFYSFSTHPFGFKPDIIVSYSNIRFIRIYQKFFFLIRIILKYKYFIYISTGSSILKNFSEFKLFHFFRKKTMVIFTGCDVRMPEAVLNLNWNTCKDCTQEYKDFVGCVIEDKKKKLNRCEELFDVIYCPDECAGFLKREYFNTFFPVNLENFPMEKYQNNKLNKKLTILHAPSNPIYKGTPFILAAIEKLKINYDFNFKLVRNVSIEELYKEIISSDLIIDSIIGGFYGLFSVESMAMYKPVVGFIRKELPVWEKIQNDCPIYNTDPDKLYSTLENILLDPGQLIEAGKRSREYVEKYHDANKIARRYIENFERGN